MDKRELYVKKFHVSDGISSARLSAKQVAALLSVSIKTVYRWMNGATMPSGYRELLEIKALGTVPGLPGVHVWEGELFTPTGYQLNAVELDQYGRMLPQVAALARENQRLQAEVKRLKAWLQQLQPEPRPADADQPRRSPWWTRHERSIRSMR